MNQTTEISEAKKVAAIIIGTGKTDSMIAMRPVSVRIDLCTLARIDAMADKSDKSRNDMINMLLDVGCESVWENLEHEQIEELLDREKYVFEKLLSTQSLREA